MIVGDKVAYKDEQPVQLDVPAKIVDGRTLIPVRFISEALGNEVIWKQDSKFVAIRSKPSLTWYKNDKVLEFIDAGPTRVPFNVNLYCKSGSELEYEKGQDIIFEVEVLNSTTAFYYQAGQQDLKIECFKPTIIIQTQSQFSENSDSYILKKVLPPISYQLLKPGESYSIRWTWDQTDSSGKIVSPGNYLVKIVNDINNPKTGLSFIDADGNQQIQTNLTPIPFTWHWVKIVY